MQKNPSYKYNFTFLIVNINGIDTNVLDSCLSSIDKYCKERSQIIVVDNGSTDSSRDYCNKFNLLSPHDLVFMPLNKNMGPSAARQHAISHIEGFVTVILDNDAQLTESSLFNVYEKYIANPKLGIIQPLLIVKNSGLVDYAGDYMTCLGMLAQNVEPLTDPADIDASKINCKILSAKSAGLFIRSEALKIVGGFDPWFFIYVEETDLGWRCWLNGYENYSLLSNLILHSYGSSSKTLGKSLVNINSAFYGTRNYLATLYLNEIGIRMLSLVSINILCWIIFNLSCLLRGETKRAYYSTKGIISFFISIKTLKSKKMTRKFPTRDELVRIRHNIYVSIPFRGFLVKFFRRKSIGNSVKPS